MDGYDYLAGFLLLFVFFIYITWFGFSVKVENQKDQPEKISINLSILPLISEELTSGITNKINDFMGTLVIFEDISSEKRVKIKSVCFSGKNSR